MRRLVFLSSPLFALALAIPVSAQRPYPLRDRLEEERCTPASGSVATLNGDQWIARARAATGLDAANDRVVHWRSTESDAQAYQSDRPYPPYIGSATLREWWFDPSTGAERWQDLPANGVAFVRSANAAFMLRDSIPRAVPPLFAFNEKSRPLNPLAVLTTFGKISPRVTEVCTFRDFPRVVLSANGERLYLDTKSAMPVKFERVERNDVWGQLRAEYVYATWWRSGHVAIPVVAVRYADGVEELRRDVRLPQSQNDVIVEDVPRSDAPSLAAPDADQRDALVSRTAEMQVDTVRVSDDLFLLRTRFYTHAVTQVGDTVYLFDATTGEGRSRADSTWIAALFPKAKGVVLVVSDLAWPHVAGVRFWAARGATIVAHDISRPFLQQLLDRRWTVAPDLLEKGRSAKRPPSYRLVTHGDGFTLAGGKIRVKAIDGIGSEGALYAWFPAQRFLWASDYLQDVSQPSQYAVEVLAAMRRDGIAPDRVAAQHLPMTPWTTVERANPGR